MLTGCEEPKFTILEEDNVCLLIVRNVLELVVESWGEAGIGESLLAPLRESLLVESILKVLEL